MSTANNFLFGIRHWNAGDTILNYCYSGHPRLSRNFGDVDSQKAFLLAGKTRIKETAALFIFFTLQMS